MRFFFIFLKELFLIFFPIIGKVIVYVAEKEIQGNHILEEIYKDDHTFVSMHMIDRYNIERSTSYIYDENRYNR
ncbi:2OG-Fe dioxygenase family protein [Bartonella saheliensis]|uniref:2OG-Fe dioxygenase family protein n=1 Tax=Bartonella saheliensis TaxID=1457016 RepID=UPI0011A658DE